MRTLLIIAGFLSIALFIFHLFFWKLFDWKNDLKKVTQLNSSVTQIMNLCLMLLFLIFAYFSIFLTEDLVTTSLGLSLLFGISIFWMFRAVLQIVFFGLRETVSAGFFTFFALLSALYMVPFVNYAF